MRVIVEPDEAALPLLEFLSLRFIGASKTQLRRLIGTGNVTVDERPAGSNRLVQPGQVVELPREELPEADLSDAIKIDVVHEDEAHMVVNKPPGHTVLPTRDGSGREFYNGLFLYLNPQWPEGERFVRPHVVHRLDRETSGVLLVAKDTEAGRRLSRQFERNEVHKTYLAIMDGCPPREAFTVELPLARKRGSVLEMAVDFKKGKPSQTRVRVLECLDRFSLIEARPLTGRQHQIRVHAAAVGHPLAVDFLYGQRRALTRSEVPGADGKGVLLARCPLHAAEIAYAHPRTGERRTAAAPLPSDFEFALAAIRDAREKK